MTNDLAIAQQAYGSLPGYLKSPYHDPDYVTHDAKEKHNAEPVFFIFKSAGEIYYHPLHKIYTPEFKVTDFESARGYGGPISTSNDKDFLSEAFCEYQEFVTENNILVEFIRFSPILENQNYYYGQSWFDRATCAIDLTGYALEKNSHGAVSNINKALKNGCRVIITNAPADAQLQAFSRIYHERMLELKADDQYLFTEDHIKSFFSGHNELALVEWNSEIIAAAIFLNSSSWHEYHLSAANTIGRKFGVINLILHSFSMQNLDDSTILHLGGGTDQHADNKLLQFKQGMGKLKKAFHIGKYIHQPDRYQQLKLESISSKSISDTIMHNNRVIFYR